MKNILNIAFFLVSTLSVFAGGKGIVVIDKETKIRANTACRIADRMYAESYYYNAAEIYKLAFTVDQKNRYAAYWLAKSYLMSRDYEKSSAMFNKFTEIKALKPAQVKRFKKDDNKYFAHFGFDYGCALQMNANYTEAIRYFQEFIKNYQGDDKEAMSNLAKAHIEGCNFAIANPESKKIKILSLGKQVNNAYTEGSPFPIGDSILYFSSLNQGKLIHINGKLKDLPKSKIYTMAKDENGKWGSPTALPASINDPAFEQGNASFSADGNRMYFTRCYHPQEDEVICNLFLSEKKNGKWSAPVRLNDPINDPRFTSTHPTVRQGENNSDIVYFLSDRPGGIGDMDIWFFIRNVNGNLKGPNPLPKPINTTGTEFTPFFDNFSNTLYFSSEGLPGYGGLDVFKTSPTLDVSWTQPVNMGMPINSMYDDFYYARVANNPDAAGYLVSNRKGTTPLNSETAADDIFHFENFKYGLEGVISREDGDGSPLTGAVVKLYAKDSNGQDSLVAIDSTVSAQGDYFFKLSPDADYSVIVERAGFKPKVEPITTKGLPMEDTLNQNFQIKTNVVNLAGVVFKEGDATMNPLENVQIQLFVKNGSKEILVSTLNTSTDKKDFSLDLEKDKKYIARVRKDGYFAKVYDLDPKEFGDAVTAQKNLPLTMIEMDKSYTLSNIYYEFGKATLTTSSEKVLDDLKKLLDENASIVIELSAHTDSKGSDSYNLALSQKRAESCVSYLISKGIEKSRLVPKGYGETKPLVPNSKDDGSDDEAGRAKNRRTEFKIIGELKPSVKIGFEDKDQTK